MDRNDFNDPWVTGVYETGRTRPPKRRSGCCAAVLVIFIFLFGLLSLLSILGVRFFNRLMDRSPDTGTIALEVSQTPTEEVTETSTDPQVHQDNQIPQMHLSTSPTGTASYVGEACLPLQEIYERNIPSVVSISCQTRTGSASGTGVVLSNDGYIVTNAHVVENAAAITVLLTDGRELYATLVGADSISDLAVLQVEADALVSAEFGDSAVLRVGDSVAAIGDPLGVGLRGTLTNGIVSAINRDVSVGGRTMTLIQTNAAINSGNSGGPLINCYGQVIGIITLKIGDTASSAGVEGIGFAIPSSTVQQIVNELMTQGYVSGRPSLGVTGMALSSFYQSYFHLPSGYYIEEVLDSSPAHQAGIQPGDVLISVVGAAVSTGDDIAAALYGHQVGEYVDIVISRNGRYYQVNLELIEATN